MTDIVVVKVKRSEAEALMVWIGYRNLAKYDLERYSLKLNEIKNILPEGQTPEDEGVANTLLTVVAAVEAGHRIEVVEDDPAAAGTVTPAAGRKPKTEAEKAADKEKKEADKKAAKEKKAAETAAAKEKEKDDKAAAKKAEKDAKKAAKQQPVTAAVATDGGSGKEDKAKADDAPRPGGVRPVRSREYLAGMMFAKYGLQDGVTEKLVLELDGLADSPNFRRSWFAAGDSWHTINGYLNQFPVPDKRAGAQKPAEQPAAPVEQPAEAPAAPVGEAAPAEVKQMSDDMIEGHHAAEDAKTEAAPAV